MAGTSRGASRRSPLRFAEELSTALPRDELEDRGPRAAYHSSQIQPSSARQRHELFQRAFAATAAHEHEEIESGHPAHILSAAQYCLHDQHLAADPGSLRAPPEDRHCPRVAPVVKDCGEQVDVRTRRKGIEEAVGRHLHSIGQAHAVESLKCAVSGPSKLDQGAPQSGI